jgi:hypothetical protein
VTRILLVLAVFSLYIYFAFGGTIGIRGPKGKQIRTEKTDGDTTVVRKSYGKPIEKRVTRGSRIEMRDTDGRLFTTETVR